MSDENVYELTLTQNYVCDWSINDAFRELIQNGTDQEIIDESNKFELIYDNQKQELTFRNAKSKLQINSLLLGRSSKSTNDDTVGKFGEGYKIAALVLNRLGKTFTIYNNEKNEVWRSRFKNSSKWREKILAFYVEKHLSQNTGLDIVVGNISDSEYIGIYEVWLGMEDNDDYEKVSTSFGDILTDEDHKGLVYVNKLFVYEDQDLNYGYDFKPQYITLERDRKTCSGWDVQSLTARMISEAVVNGLLPMESVEKLVSKNANDVKHFTYTSYSKNTQKIIEKLVQSFNRQHPEPTSIPVAKQSQIDRVKAFGGNPVPVPYQVAELIEDEIEHRIKTLSLTMLTETLSFKERFTRWLNAYQSQLSEEAIKDLQTIIDKL